MIDDRGPCERDLSALMVPVVGRLIATGDRYEPFRMLGPDEMAVEPVTAFFRDLLAAGRAEATVRSYVMDLLRWFRPVNCTVSLIFSQADRLGLWRSVVWSRTCDVA